MNYYHFIRTGSGVIRVPSSLPEALAPFILEEQKKNDMASFKEAVHEMISKR